MPLAVPRPLDPIIIAPEVCRDFAQASKLEWLETNGTGSYAMGTVSAAHTRRYHGLLVAAVTPPLGRHVTLSKLDESICFDDGRSYALGTNQYPGALHPQGYRHLAAFRTDPFPSWTYRVDDFNVEKRVLLVRGQPTVIVEYRADRPCRLRVEPLVAFRDAHALRQRDDRFDDRIDVAEGRVRTRPMPELPPLTLHHSRGHFEHDADWHYRVEYLEELARGFDFREDLYRLGTIELDLDAGRPAWIVATLASNREAPRTDDDVRTTFHDEEMRRRSSFRNPFLARLDRAADAFIVKRDDGARSVIAGYPWFADWGRDAMVSLPGLFLARGLPREAEGLVRSFTKHLRRGVIPNRFGEQDGKAEYNTVDATLWMFQAVSAYLSISSEDTFVRREFYPVALEIMRHYRQGTHRGIHVDDRDGLLAAGDPHTQLTWMDAKVGDEVITPRHGKPVEVNALYYNALCLMSAWARRFGYPDDSRIFEVEATKVAESFASAFWNATDGCLYDVIGPDGPDARIRPNQIFAVSLPYPLMLSEERKAILAVVTAQLLTPFGLRTLSPADPSYRARYRGNARERDAAYHQGVVWPWLLGPYVRAYLTVFGRNPESIAHSRALLSPFERHFSEAGLGTISEIFEGEPPFRPVGAPAQAWSVAELMAISVFDLHLD